MNKPSRVIVVLEDDHQKMLIYRYLVKCGWRHAVSRILGGDPVDHLAFLGLAGDDCLGVGALLLIKSKPWVVKAPNLGLSQSFQL